MKFYRYEDLAFSDKVQIIEKTFELVKVTPCGYWIKENSWFAEEKRWVSKTTKKRYAYPTQKEAMISFKTRKRMQIQILQGRLNQAIEALYQTDQYSI